MKIEFIDVSNEVVYPLDKIEDQLKRSWWLIASLSLLALLNIF